MLTDYIKKSWDECVRYQPEDEDTLIGLPYPYIVPNKRVGFQEMYYWDTFFTCQGLLLSGKEELVKNCTDDMLYLVNKYGFMPNGNRTYYLRQSQPPFLSMMVMDVYRTYQDKEWLKNAYETLKKEYQFWMTQRITPLGLNKFDARVKDMSQEEADMHYYGCCERIGYTIPSEDHFQVARNFLTDCESGWDFNPRTELSQSDCVYVDLNCNLYLYEKNFAEYAQILENGESKIWEEKAEQRKALMNRYLWDGEAFMDYNMKQEKTCPVFSVASFYALWAGVANEEQAAKTVAKLSKLEYPYGIAACEKNEVPGQYQWDYPTGWPPHQYLMIQALERYGYKEDARRIAEKYVTVCEKIYQETGDLWEKFHVEKGDQNTEKDYEAHRMIGWAAGVYLFAKHYLEQ
ncbi:MAG: alpha,alpha-trehalase [Clostridia bacterium]|nr:alpha,alpha-trehalase [Clostridia bacterium]MBQ2940985.1 alpha,alpha-trehalase [Clostridia bacterium]